MLQLALLIWGVVILAKRRVQMSKKRVVTGGPAIAIGTIFVCLMPLGFVAGIVLGGVLVAQGIPVGDITGYAIFMDVGLLACALIAAFIIAARYGVAEGEKQIESAIQEPTGATFPQPSDPSNPYSPPSSPSD